MNPNTHLVPLAAALLAGGFLQAQKSTTLLPVPLTETPRSVVVAPQSTGTYVICSMSTASRQIPVNVSNPFVPVVNPSSTYVKDQFCDAYWTPAFGGRLVTAHRGGDLVLWDATTPFLNSFAPSIGMTPTTHSHEGLKTFTDPLNNTYVLYSEQHVSTTTSGGLKLFRMNANSFTFLGQQLFLGGAGSALEYDRFGRTVWQWGDQGSNQFNGVLRVYSSNGYTGNPILITTIPYPFTYGYPDRDLERNDSQTVLVSALGWDGLAAINVTNVTAPVINTIVGPNQMLFFDGVTFLPGTDVCLIWGHFLINNVRTDYMLFANTFVSGGQAWVSPIFSFLPGFKVDDVKIRVPDIHCVGRDSVTNASLLRIY